MGGENFVLTYVQACSSGKLPLAECAPVWQLGVIAALLVCAVVLLVTMTMRPSAQSAYR